MAVRPAAGRTEQRHGLGKHSPPAVYERLRLRYRSRRYDSLPHRPHHASSHHQPRISRLDDGRPEQGGRQFSQGPIVLPVRRRPERGHLLPADDRHGGLRRPARSDVRRRSRSVVHRQRILPANRRLLPVLRHRLGPPRRRRGDGPGPVFQRRRVASLLARIALSYALAPYLGNMAIAHAEGLQWIVMLACYVPYFLWHKKRAASP